MKIIITEQQKRIILTESTGEKLGNILKQSANRVTNYVNEAQNQMGINLQFLFTWGAGIGGFVGLVEDFVRERFPTISEEQVMSICIGVIATYFLDNKKAITKIYEKIQDEGLNGIFEKVLKKSDLLRNTLLDFIESLGVTFHRVTNMLSYIFILPLIPPIVDIVKSGSIEHMDTKELAIRIIGFAGVTISGIILKDLLSKMIRRFKRE
jgi:hypothetical protein